VLHLLSINILDLHLDGVVVSELINDLTKNSISDLVCLFLKVLMELAASQNFFF
jgi:hypothetical protein